MLTSAVSPSIVNIPLPQEAGSTPAGGGSFAGIMDQVLGGAVRSGDSAEAAVQSLATGQNDNLHGVLLQVAQADLAFHLILEIRNRLTDAYQEIMKMQV